MKRLLLEGGAQRGLFTQGVLDAFMEEDIYFDEVDAISAGGLSAMSYKSRDLHRSLNVMRFFTGNPNYFSIRNYLKERSVFGWDFIFNDINREFPLNNEAFKKNPMVVKVGAFDVESGEMKYFQCDDLEDPNTRYYLTASSSLPIYTTFPRIDGHTYCDGGIGSPFAFDCYSKEDRTIMITTQSKDYRKKDKDAISILIKLKYRKYPKLIEAYLNRPKVYNQQLMMISKLEEKKEIITLRPPENVKVKRTETDKSKLEELYAQGYCLGKKRAREIKEYLNG